MQAWRSLCSGSAVQAAAELCSAHDQSNLPCTCIFGVTEVLADMSLAPCSSPEAGLLSFPMPPCACRFCAVDSKICKQIWQHY